MNTFNLYINTVSWIFLARIAKLATHWPILFSKIGVAVNAKLDFDASKLYEA